jgi:hypothetical protein
MRNKSDKTIENGYELSGAKVTYSFQRDSSRPCVSMDHIQRNFLSSRKLTMIAALSIVIIGVVVYHRVPFQEIANYDEMISVGAVQQPGVATLKRILTWNLTWCGTGSRQTGYYAPLPVASITLDLRKLQCSANVRIRS